MVSIYILLYYLVSIMHFSKQSIYLILLIYIRIKLNIHICLFHTHTHPRDNISIIHNRLKSCLPDLPKRTLEGKCETQQTSRNYEKEMLLGLIARLTSTLID